jgi:hypothetical protein
MELEIIVLIKYARHRKTGTASCHSCMEPNDIAFLELESRIVVSRQSAGQSNKVLCVSER